MQNFTKLVALGALITSTFTLFAGCAASRYEGVERRADRYDARYDARMDRRELRSERADARYSRW